MFHVEKQSGDPSKDYQLLIKQVEAITDGEPDLIANLANAAALLYHSLPEVNWAGFYLAKGGELVLGPFNGLPACVRIPSGKGVCGTAFATGDVQRIADVHAFPGHIACDAASQSEIVIPLKVNGQIIGVLDIDSPVKDRFNEVDETYLVQFTEVLQHALSASTDAS
ncbi:GAF domain-containing protein [Bacillus altitudinis]|uniref:GAF domain-containing protein n=1 Tax=Bacillus altitudinis TaxID=293387 RepID=UPI000BC3196E|nr:GAF domain-containing protein [Bacillus altitudinis]ATH73287.1 GAF domain-containing protein [Bacillus altitudinis]MCY7628092.1 GAF domain-containing protein [Bacillus altitudinis]MCY7713223.1 GAF domain-containing protein [Bacillus altitudinis]MDM5163987.1 GAF domain-containing protein [Bacillus altitudinis]MDX2364256.1 GAF domain-containing protein [Bacillus altitudinis]